MMRRLFAGGAAWSLVLGLTLLLTAPSIAATTTTLYLSKTGNPTAALEETPPSDGFFLGRLIGSGGSGIGESDPTQYQAWHTSSGGQTLAGHAELRFWGAMLSFDEGNDGLVIAYLMDCDAGKTNCSPIATASLHVDDLLVGMGNWSEQTLDFGTVSHAIAKNRKLGVKLIVDNSSSADLWVLYGTTAHPSRLLLDTVPPTTTTTSTTTTAPPATTTTPPPHTTTTPPPLTTTSTTAPTPSTTTTPPGPTTTTQPTTTTVSPTTTTTFASTPFVTYPPQSPPTTTVYAAPSGETAPPTTSVTQPPTPADPEPATGTQSSAAPVRSESPFSRQTNPAPDTAAAESQPQPASATFLLTPERRNGGLTPTRVLGVVFHLIVENLNFNLLPALLLGAITTWFTMRGVRDNDLGADDQAGTGWVV